ncbi:MULTISPECIES: DUF4826 family protein [unclassified Pseudoalteromonas]|uniref:DUF4826 family protein n=1 Tax=unclassified Pseudoalteromonas TaxID=194690 RepID=UPI0020976FDE|nr:DUF4826 family protein [Pseudoalteromonas sp. XMcav2-N]MCO7187318.1 DUF4826 family protein [Pseudoalteromonas sp. XMcav2-N]
MNKHVTQLSEEQQQWLAQWQQTSLQAAQKYLAEKGILGLNIQAKESRILPPICGIWKIKDNLGKGYWVISGKVPTDSMPVSGAADARAALKHFSYQWQIKADKILAAEQQDPAQVEYANILVQHAHGLYDMASEEQLWANAAS